MHVKKKTKSIANYEELIMNFFLLGKLKMHMMKKLSQRIFVLQKNIQLCTRRLEIKNFENLLNKQSYFIE